MSYGFQMAELRLDSFENIQFFDVSVFSQTTLCLGLLFYTLSKGKVNTGKVLKPGHQLGIDIDIGIGTDIEVRLNHLCNQELKDPIP